MEIINKPNNKRKNREEMMPQTSSKGLSKKEETIAVRLFGTEKKLLEIANPVSQIKICKNAYLCFFGNYPTLYDVSKSFSRNTPIVWLIPQLYDLSEYCGCRDKLDAQQLEQCAQLIANKYAYLKITELMLFFYRFKLARYGRFYGSVDPMLIMEALYKFIQERNEAYFKHDQQQQEERDRKAKINCITWEEYCSKYNIQGKESPLTKIFKHEKSNH